MRHFKKIASLSSLTISLFSISLMADSDKIKPLDPVFLGFLANISETDGQFIDPLNMLEISETDMQKKQNIAKDNVGIKMKNPNGSNQSALNEKTINKKTDLKIEVRKKENSDGLIKEYRR